MSAAEATVVAAVVAEVTTAVDAVAEATAAVAADIQVIRAVEEPEAEAVAEVGRTMMTTLHQRDVHRSACRLIS